jgi:hypothetical protein
MIRKWRIQNKSKRILNKYEDKTTVECGELVDVEVNTFPWCRIFVVELQCGLEDSQDADKATSRHLLCLRIRRARRRPV